MAKKLIDKIRDYFADDKYLTMTGVTIESVSENRCRCFMDVSAAHMNAGGSAQGGAIYTLADSAFAVACNIGHIKRGEDFITVSQSASISYIKAVTGGRLYADAVRIGGGKKSSVYQVTVTDGTGQVVALMTGNAYTVPKR